MASQLVPILTNEATAARRQVYFDLRDATDGITAETGEAGGQPQISTNGGAWTNTGIGTLTSIGSGEYYAEVTQSATNITAGGRIKTRYKSANTAESRGDTLLIMGAIHSSRPLLRMWRLGLALLRMRWYPGAWIRARARWLLAW